MSGIVKALENPKKRNHDLVYSYRNGGPIAEKGVFAFARAKPVGGGLKRKGGIILHRPRVVLCASSERRWLAER